MEGVHRHSISAVKRDPSSVYVTDGDRLPSGSKPLSRLPKPVAPTAKTKIVGGSYYTVLYRRYRGTYKVGVGLNVFPLQKLAVG